MYQIFILEGISTNLMQDWSILWKVCLNLQQKKEHKAELNPSYEYIKVLKLQRAMNKSFGSYE